MMRSSGRDLRRHLERQHGLLELRRRGAARGRFLVRDLLALLDHRLLAVRRDHARCRDHLAAAFVLRGGDLEVDDVVRVEQRHGDPARRVRDRQVDHVAVVDRRRRDQAALVERRRSGRGSGRTRRARCRGRCVPTKPMPSLPPWLNTAAPPKRTPSSREKSSLTMTMRASISTCRTGMSSVDTSRADVGEPFRRVLQQQRVGPLVDRDAAALGEERALALRLDQRRQVGSLGVVDLQVLGAHRRELGHRLARLEQLLLAGRQLLRRRDVDDVALVALVEALGAQHDVERLVPRHVLQAQRDVALHGVADHDVLAARLGEQLQHGAGLDVLEVERQALALVFLLLLRRGGGLRDRLQLERVLAVGLVGGLLVVAGRGDDDARARRACPSRRRS